MTFYLSAYRADPAADYLFAWVRRAPQEIGPDLQIGLHDAITQFPCSWQQTIEDLYHLAKSPARIVLTDQCNAHCVYCQAQSEHAAWKGRMSRATAQKAVALAMDETTGKTV